MKSKQLGYLGIGNRRSLNVVQRPFSPLDLFATGEQGVWYDPSDLSTMFQDSAGTTPVTAVEQPVGLLLDKSKGLVLGPELVTNGTGLVSTTGWTPVQTAVLSAVGGALRITSSTPYDQARQTITTVVGKSYRVSFTVGAIPNNQVYADAASVSSGLKTTAGTYSFIFRAVSTSTTLSLIFTGTGNVDFSNISVREIAGNHASQSTSASRPTLSARYNLLTYSEQFDDAAWTKVQGAITQNSVVAPDGTTTADVFTGNGTDGVLRQADASAPAGDYTASVWLKVPSGTLVTRLGISNGAGSNVNNSIITVTTSWQRFTFTTNRTATGVGLYVGGYNSIANGVAIHIWGAQLIATNDLTSNAYQRIAAATDYDSDATKFSKYLRFDGTDDSLATSSIDFSGTNKLSIFSALRRLSDSAQGMVLELSATTASNNGTFSLETPSTASGSDFQFISKGTVANTINADDYPNPYSAIITAQSAISTPLSNIRINGLEVDSDAGTQGTGNFGNFPLYVGRRNNASLPFNGRLYGMIVRGAETPEYLVEITETWLFGKSGITLDTTPDYTFVTLSNGDFVVDAYGNNVFIEVS